MAKSAYKLAISASGRLIALREHMDLCLQALDYYSDQTAMVFERRMSEFMAVSEGNHRACGNVHPADARGSAWNGLW